MTQDEWIALLVKVGSGRPTLGRAALIVLEIQRLAKQYGDMPEEELLYRLAVLNCLRGDDGL